MLSLFPTAVQLPVGDDLDAVERLFVDGLGFVVKAREPGALLVDNGALTLRLVRGNVGDRPRLELTCPSLDEATRHLVAWGGHVEPSRELADGWLERDVRMAVGPDLILRHQVPEDLRPTPPALPTQLVWEPGAVALLQDLLRSVPPTFRGDARRAATAQAEALALAAGSVEVTPSTAARGFLLATPTFGREGARAELAGRGFELALIASWERP